MIHFARGGCFERKRANGAVICTGVNLNNDDNGKTFISARNRQGS